MKTFKRDGDAVPTVAVRGELDIYTAPEFEQRLVALADTEPLGVVVDLGESTFVDVSACRVLLRTARRLRGHGAQLVVISSDGEVARICKVMGLEDYLTVVPSRGEARLVLSAA